MPHEAVCDWEGGLVAGCCCCCCRRVDGPADWECLVTVLYGGGAVDGVSLYGGRIVLARLLLRLGDVGETSFFGLGSFCCSSVLEEAGITIMQVWIVKALCLRHCLKFTFEGMWRRVSACGWLAPCLASSTRPRSRRLTRLLLCPEPFISWLPVGKGETQPSWQWSRRKPSSRPPEALHVPVASIVKHGRKAHFTSSP